MDPEFSVIIPTYNRVATLGKSIESVIGQTFPAHQIIVVDDGSTDLTAKLVKNYPDVHYIYQENAGVSFARNTGAEAASGDWLIFLDSDDELFPNALEEFFQAILNQSDSRIFLSGYRWVGAFFHKIEDRKAKHQKYNPPLSGTFAIKKDLFLSVGKYDPLLGFGENMELFLRLNKFGEVPRIIESMTLIYYESASGGSKSLENKNDALSLILEKHGSGMANIDLWNLYQVLGVVQLRSGEFANARKSLLTAIQNQPLKFSTYLRFLIACLPFLSRKIYKSNSFT